MQWRPITFISDDHVCVVLYEKPDDGSVAVLTAYMKRCLAFIVSFVDVSAGLQQELDNFNTVMRARFV
jgi:hypothetical protein